MIILASRGLNLGAVRFRKFCKMFASMIPCYVLQLTEFPFFFQNHAIAKKEKKLKAPKLQFIRVCLHVNTIQYRKIFSVALHLLNRYIHKETKLIRT